LAAFIFQAGNRARYRFEVVGIELPVAACDDTRAKLDDRASRCPQPLLLLRLWSLTFHGILLYHPTAHLQLLCASPPDFQKKGFIALAKLVNLHYAV
jgi:hypothetical protein